MAKHSLQVHSCILVTHRFLRNGVYKLKCNTTVEQYLVYCRMTEIPGCGPGGWTLVMKIDGKKVKMIKPKKTFFINISELKQVTYWPTRTPGRK